ncbi:response regulator transcription factor [Candidatus Formimonas warabiya]|uniref:Heme response regulator HssR n=1 Tax=Formimonas warabiya TaxID=1761012 RepID=A0A3G1KTH8_FORW1|nr:response regulator transcription factor [Candidatus Formimonas warabiya]ATW25771.1 DNA-binding response regulator [Candidatus Formimonas warabiya]
MSRIMIVDDDNYIRELVSTLLKNEGFRTDEATDGRDALQKFSKTIPDLCIIDIMMPNMDGFELCRNIRRYYEDMPVLMLTAKGEISQKVKGFEQGTDDYLTKPFEAPELILRVKALLRRYKVISSQRVQIGTLTIDKNSYTIFTDGEKPEKLDIPMKEFELLFKLAGTPNKTFTRDQLIEDVWGYDFEGNERTLDVHVNRLRERFPAEQYRFKITTVRGLGYRLEELT